MSLDPRKLNSLSKAGKYTANANLIGITQRVFMKDSDAKELIASGNFTRADVILSYEESTQILRKWNHNYGDWETLGGGSSGESVRAFPSRKALEDASNLLLGGDSDGLKVKEKLYLLEDTMGLVAWDSDADEFVSVTGATQADIDSDFHVLMALDSDFKHRLRFNENIKFVEEDSDLPTAVGKYVFRSTRPGNTALRNAFVHYHGIGVADSDAVKGAIFYYNGTLWEAVSTYEDTDPFITQEDITFVKIGDKRWSTLLQNNSTFTSVVSTLDDLTDTLKNESNGTVYVEAEQETYYWSGAHDQSVNNGWSRFWPKNVDTLAEYRALGVGERFTVRSHITGLPNMTTNWRGAEFTATELNDQWSEIYFADVSTNISNTSAQVTYYNRGGFNANSGDVIINATSSSTYSADYKLSNFFISNNNGWIIGSGLSDGRLKLDFTGGADAYPAVISFYPNRSSSNAFATVRMTAKYGDGTYQHVTFTPDSNNTPIVEWFNPNLDSPLLNLWLYFSAENGTDGGCRFFRLGWPATFRKKTNVIPPGSYVKTGPNDSDYEETSAINISTGTRFIKSYPNEASMVASRLADQHFEGGIYRINTNSGYAVYYEYNKAVGDTPAGDISDYNLISARPQTFEYANEAGLIADQANQTTNQWYYAGTSMYHYKGTTTSTLNDYTKIGGTAWSDRDLLIRRKNNMFIPQDVTYHWDDIRTAKTDGYLTAGTAATGTSSWHDTYIERATYFDVKVPAGTAVMAIRSICDTRNGNWYLRYTDGNQEIIGENGHGTTPAEVEPGLWGIDNPWSKSYFHKWVIFPVSKVNRNRTVRVWRDPGDDSYLSGLAFASENIWQFSTVNVISLTRNKMGTTWPTELARQVNLPISLASNSVPWNSGNNSGSALAQPAAASTYRSWVTAAGGGDQILWFYAHKDGSNTWSTMANFKIKVNDMYLDSDCLSYVGTNGSAWSDNFPRLHPGWDNPMQGFANSQDNSSFLAIHVPGHLIKIMTDSDGIAVPTPQLVQYQTAAQTDINYIRKVGFMKYDLGEHYMQLGTSYTPANSSHWNTSPTTTADAIDRLAALVYSLNGNTPIA